MLPYCLAWLQHMNPVLLPEEATGVWLQWDHENWDPCCTRHCPTALSLTPLKRGWGQEIISSFGVILPLISTASKLPLLFHSILRSVFTIHKLSILRILLLSFWFNDSPTSSSGSRTASHDMMREMWGRLQELGSISINIPIKKGALQIGIWVFFSDKVVSQSVFSGFPL